MTQAQILLIDDDPDFTRLMMAALQDDYEVEVAESGADALLVLETSQPDLILLDVELPDTDGFQLCEKLRDRDAERQVPILFVSANDEPAMRQRAFAMGADDYLEKPIDIPEARARMASLLKYARGLKDMAAANRHAQQVAFQSMSESSMYGSVVSFFREAIACKTYQDLAAAFFRVMDQFGLKAALQLRGNTVMTLSGPSESSPAVEANLFEALREAGRLYHFGARTMVNDQYVSFLVKNMPVEDEVAYGRLKDMVAVVIEGLQASCLAIRRNDLIRLLFDEIKHILADVHANFGREDSRVMEALRRLQLTLPEIHSSLHFLDLNEEQEAYFEQLLDQGVVQTETLVSFLQHLQGSLEQLAGRLRLG